MHNHSVLVTLITNVLTTWAALPCRQEESSTPLSPGIGNGVHRVSGSGLPLQPKTLPYRYSLILPLVPLSATASLRGGLRGLQTVPGRCRFSPAAHYISHGASRGVAPSL